MQHEIGVHHFVLHSDEVTLCDRIQNDVLMGPSNFRFDHVTRYFDAAEGWLHHEATVVDTRYRDAREVAQHISELVAELR